MRPLSNTDYDAVCIVCTLQRQICMRDIKNNIWFEFKDQEAANTWRLSQTEDVKELHHLCFKST